MAKAILHNCNRKNRWYSQIHCRRPEDIEAGFYASYYDSDKTLLNRKNKKVIGLMKDKLSGKNIKEFAEVRTKTFSNFWQWS